MSIDYDAWAKTYDDSRGASPSVLGPIEEELGAPDGRSLLDIGGGTGNFARPLAEAGFLVSLVDFSPEMIRRARTKLDADLFAVVDAQRLPLRDATFDCAISVNVLGHLPDWQLAVAEARRVLREDPPRAQGVDARDRHRQLDHELLPGHPRPGAAAPLPTS